MEPIFSADRTALLPDRLATFNEPAANLVAPRAPLIENAPRLDRLETIPPQVTPVLTYRHPATVLACEIINQEYRETLSLGSVARRVNVSAGYFSILIKRATGLNFVAYLAQLRVEKAKNLLENPRFRVSEVAFEVGFGSVSQFNRTFRRLASMSPRAYRATLAEPNKA